MCGMFCGAVFRSGNSNVEHAKEILALLILQAGNPITEKDR